MIYLNYSIWHMVMEELSLSLVTRGTSKSISNKKQMSYLYKPTADVKIALGVKVFSKIFTYAFACGV